MRGSSKFEKLVVFDNLILTEQQKERLIRCTYNIEFYPKTDDPVLVAEIIKDSDAVINCWTVIPKEAIRQAPNLEYIGNWGHWWKHRIIITEEELENRKIRLDHIPDYGTQAVAELTWTGILALYKNLESWHKDAERGKWTYENIKRGDKKVNISEVQERTLENKVLGIVGLGRIGSKVAMIGKHGFELDVIYNSRTRKKEFENQGIKYCSLQDLFVKSDIISVHVPSDAPDKFISKKIIGLMKSNSLFINTSVGHVVDQEALIEKLKKRKIKAFLDVYDGFPPRKDLKDLPNVIFTYRLGWFTKDSLERKGEILVSNIEKYLNKKSSF